MTSAADMLQTEGNHSVEHVSLSVLCVDDDATIRMSIERALKDEDFQVLTAASGEEGLELLRTRDDICLIISDQSMPGLSGTEFLESAQKVAADIPRMILTGHADLQEAVKAINTGGICRYILKPWNNDELRQLVRDTVEKYRLRKENERLTGIVKRQNAELLELNESLKKRVLAQTAQMRRQIEELRQSTGKAPSSPPAPVTVQVSEPLVMRVEPAIMSFLSMIEAVNEKFYSHTCTVATLSAAMARALALDAKTCQEVRIAALLHDIGIHGFSISFEYKDLEAMSFREKAEFLIHPVRGQAAATFSREFEEVGLMIRHHHEAFDGSGFPDKLYGENISLGARILAIANAAEKYITAQATGRALEQVQYRMGTEFDPHLNDVFVTAMAEVFTEKSRGTGATMELQPQDLSPGLVVCEDVRSGTGVLLLASGTHITDDDVRTMQYCHQIDPFKKKVKVR